MDKYYSLLNKNKKRKTKKIRSFIIAFSILITATCYHLPNQNIKSLRKTCLKFFRKIYYKHVLSTRKWKLSIDSLLSWHTLQLTIEQKKITYHTNLLASFITFTASTILLRKTRTIKKRMTNRIARKIPVQKPNIMEI